MQRPPRSPQESLFSGGLTKHVLWVGAVIGLLALGVGILYFDPNNPADVRWQTMIFTSLAFMQMGQALASRSTEESIFTLGLRSNLVLTGLVVLTAVLQLAAIYIPFLDQFFQVTALDGPELLLCAGLGVVVLLLIEGEKFLLRRKRNN